MSKNADEASTPSGGANPYKWTVIVHLAGENNLGEECVYALTDMQSVELSKEVSVIAHLDSIVYEDATIVIEHETKTGALIDKIRKFSVAGPQTMAGHQAGAGQVQGAQGQPPQPPSIPSYADVLRDFFVKTMETYRADHYMLILNGHGSGSVGGYLSKQVGDAMT